MGAILSASCQTINQSIKQSKKLSDKQSINQAIKQVSLMRKPQYAIGVVGDGNGVYEFSLYTKRVLAGLVGS
jgi:histidinol phosphatase-like enzyme